MLMILSSVLSIHTRKLTSVHMYSQNKASNAAGTAQVPPPPPPPPPFCPVLPCSHAPCFIL